MKRIFVLIFFAVACISAFAAPETNPDSIIGEYLVPDKKNGDTKVKFFRTQDGAYSCQIFWLERPVNPSTGKPWLDTKNPDKSLRSRRCDSIILVSGLKYNAEKKQWDGAKIYDPNRGIKANATFRQNADGSLTVRGTVLGIGETQIWPKLK